jgi:hypothetical protein
MMLSVNSLLYGHRQIVFPQVYCVSTLIGDDPYIFQVCLGGGKAQQMLGESNNSDIHQIAKGAKV